MEFLGEKVAYLKGLAEGLKVNESSNEGRLILAIIDVLDKMTDSISQLETDQEISQEQIDLIDEDLTDLEEFVYDDEEDEDDEDKEDDDYGFFEVDCPNCHEKVYLDEDMLDSDDEITCPKCKEVIEIDFDCDCDCGCHEEDKA